MQMGRLNADARRCKLSSVASLSHLICPQHVRGAARRAGLSETADPCKAVVPCQNKIILKNFSVLF